MLINVALYKTSFQISTYVDSFGEHSAGLANDGSRQTDFSVRENGCAASNPANYPWWAVDLDVQTLVYQVTFTNRGDAAGNNICCCLLFVMYGHLQGLNWGNPAGSQIQHLLFEIHYL